MEYKTFLKSKIIKDISSGFETNTKLSDDLFDYQKAVVRWALKKGKSAIFAECGLGKTIMQLEWARSVHEHTKKDVLILAPLAVARQTVQEGKKFGIDVTYCRKQEDVKRGITITNYEMLHAFDLPSFVGVVLDESSILKSFTGKIRNEIIDGFQYTPYKLACTATPAPNDFMELGNHCEFLNVMSRTEMLSMFFINDASDTKTWKLKGHAEDDFWRFIGSWAVMFRNPNDIGYEGDSFILPDINTEKIILPSESTDTLFAVPAETLSEVRVARKESLNDRCEETKKIIAKNPDEQWIVWCNYNDESSLLAKEIPGAVEVKGSDTIEHKEKSLIGFANKKVKILVSKPSIAGFGLNFQNCHNVVFCGLSFSYEQYYQAIRRVWRFGQT